MGEVHRARDPRLGREVAVKVLPEQFAHSDDRLARFERDARAAGAPIGWARRGAGSTKSWMPASVLEIHPEGALASSSP
jgi:hypothetical protein